MELKDIKKLAKLSRIDIDENEQKELLKDIESILLYVGEIQKVATEDEAVKIPAHRNIMREDNESHSSGKYSKDILNEAPSIEDEYIKVKHIL